MDQMKEYSKTALQGVYGDITDNVIGSKNVLYEFNPGKCLLPGFFEDYLEKIWNLPVREDDVWLVSYPRTGSTWCQEMVWLIGNDLDFDKARKTIQQLRAPLLEMSIVLSEFTEQFSDLFDNSVDYVRNLQSPRYIKSHLPLQLLPKEINKVKPKVIYTMRNIKDLCVSYFHHCKLIYGFDVNFDTFCELFLNNAVAYGGVMDHFLEFWKRRNDPNILILRYEDMKENTEGTITKIAKFLGKSLTTEEIIKLKNFLSFNSMKENESCNFERLLENSRGKKYFDKVGQHFIRKGQIGDWKNYMSADISKKFDDWIDKHTEGYSDLKMVISDNLELDDILRRDFTTVFRPGYINVDGVTLPERFAELKPQILDLDVSENDVWVCSFPKTGTTWTQEMVWMIMNNLDFEGARVNLAARFPFLEVTSLFDYRSFRKENPEFEAPPFIEDSIGFVKNARKNGPLCLKTHLPWILIPKQIQSNEKKPKIIYVTRNPKDTCLSYFNHSRLMEGYRGTFENFCKLFLGDKLNFTPYWKHVLHFWQRRDQDNILFLKYEDMIEDLPKIIKQVAAFLEKPLTEEQIEVLTDHLSFASMKNNPAVNFELIVSLNRKYHLIDVEGEFMRSGKVGEYKAKMSPKLIEMFDEWIEENTKGTGYTFYS